MFGDIHFSLSSLHVSQGVEDNENRKNQEGLSVIDEPIWEAGASCPDTSAWESSIFAGWVGGGGGAGSRQKFETKERGVFMASVSGV